MRKNILIIFAIIFLLSACNKEITYQTSIVDEDFPVPTKAKIIEGKEENPNIEKYAIYQWKLAEELESIHKNYLKEIKNHGWEEKKEEQMGALRVFSKGESIIWLSTHDGFFTISKLINE